MYLAAIVPTLSYAGMGQFKDSLLPEWMSTVNAYRAVASRARPVPRLIQSTIQ